MYVKFTGITPAEIPQELHYELAQRVAYNEACQFMCEILPHEPGPYEAEYEAAGLPIITLAEEAQFWYTEVARISAAEAAGYEEPLHQGIANGKYVSHDDPKYPGNNGFVDGPLAGASFTLSCNPEDPAADHLVVLSQGGDPSGCEIYRRADGELDVWM